LRGKGKSCDFGLEREKKMTSLVADLHYGEKKKVSSITRRGGGRVEHFCQDEKTLKSRCPCLPGPGGGEKEPVSYLQRKEGGE